MTTKTKSARKSATAKAPAPSRRTPILLIAFGAIAALLIVAIVASGDEPIGSAGEYGEPTITGTALPQMPGVGVEDPAIGMPIPEIAGQDFSGNEVVIERDGRPKAILFVWHHCGHCQNEIPEVQAWLDSGGGVDGVDIITISSAATSGRQNWPPSEWLEREGWTPPVIADDTESSVFRAYGGQGVPYWVFADGDGNVVWRNGGRLPIDTIEAAMVATLG